MCQGNQETLPGSLVGERDAFWFDDLNNYFSGPEDPNYCVVIIKPSKIELGTMGSVEPEIWKSE